MPFVPMAGVPTASAFSFSWTWVLNPAGHSKCCNPSTGAVGGKGLQRSETPCARGPGLLGYSPGCGYAFHESKRFLTAQSDVSNFPPPPVAVSVLRGSFDSIGGHWRPGTGFATIGIWLSHELLRQI